MVSSAHVIADGDLLIRVAALDDMRLDKKNLAGTLRLILWRGIGRAEIVPGVDEGSILSVLGAR